MSLTTDAIKEKLKQVDIDIEELRSTGDASRRLQVLSEYKEYLQDELKFLQNEERNSKT